MAFVGQRSRTIFDCQTLMYCDEIVEWVNEDFARIAEDAAAAAGADPQAAAVPAEGANDAEPTAAAATAATDAGVELSRIVTTLNCMCALNRQTGS